MTTRSQGQVLSKLLTVGLLGSAVAIGGGVGARALQNANADETVTAQGNDQNASDQNASDQNASDQNPSNDQNGNDQGQATAPNGSGAQSRTSRSGDEGSNDSSAQRSSSQRSSASRQAPVTRPKTGGRSHGSSSGS